MSHWRVPFNRRSAVGRELEYVAEAVRCGHLSGDGEFTRRCQSALEAELPSSRVLLTTSCTHALEMAALLLELNPGDEVILPAFTFVSTANAFVLRGATPVFADIQADTLNLDPRSVECLLTARTRAIVPVHYAGVACDMEALAKLAARSGAMLIEDNAHGLYGGYRGRPLGSFGALAALSFHETKNVSCGEGGALVVNDPALVARAEILREKGTDRCRFFRGEVDRYTWVDIGSSYVMSDLLAAFLLGQLEMCASGQERRRRLWHRYAQALATWAEGRGILMPTVPADCAPAYHIFYLLLPDLARRGQLIDDLKARGIQALFHYLPLHLSPVGARLGGRVGDCPVTEWASDRLVRLPFHAGLSDTEQELVISTLLEL